MNIFHECGVQRTEIPAIDSSQGQIDPYFPVKSTRFVARFEVVTLVLGVLGSSALTSGDWYRTALEAGIFTSTVAS